METPISFTNHGHRLAGIWHAPDQDARPLGTAVVFLHGWGTCRIGPHRLFVEAARRFTQEGFHCLRFDFRGRGESEGKTADASLLDMIDDATAAVNHVVTIRPTISSVFLLGLCSGGEVAVGAATSHPAIKGLALWSTPLLGRQANPQLQADVKKTVHQAKNYWRKLFNPDSWRKLIRGQLHYRVIAKVLFGHYAKAPREPMREVELLEKFRSFAGRVLHVHGGNDPDAIPSMDAYKTLRHGGGDAFHVIPGANHNFYSLAWKDELLSKTSAWLREGGS